MSWWTEVSGAELGDAPADAVRAGLADAGEHLAADPPEAPELLAVLERAVERALELSDRPDLVVVLDDGSRISAADTAPDAAVAALASALGTARSDYLDGLGREPTVAELAATATFVLSPRVGSAIDLPDGADLHAIQPA